MGLNSILATENKS